MKFQIFMAKSIDVPLITVSMNSHSQDIIINNQPILHIESSFPCLVPVRWLSFSTYKICVDKLRLFEIVFPIKPTEGLNILQISNFLNRTGIFLVVLGVGDWHDEVRKFTITKVGTHKKQYSEKDTNTWQWRLLKERRNPKTKT